MPGVGLYGSYGSSATTTNNTNNTNNANNEEQTEEINNSNGAEEASGANNVGGAGAAGSGITLQHNNTQDAARYQNAIDINGGVDNDDITNDGQIETSDARANIVEQYASEFYYTALTGKNARTDASALDLQAAGQRMQADLDGLNGEDAQQAATFALVASSYKNGGGNYDNGQIEDIIQQSGYNGPLADNVGTYDVQTLGAAVAAIRSGDIEISDIYDGTDNDAVDDDGKYDAAISKVLENDLGRDIGGDNNAGNAGNAGNDGDGGNENAPVTGQNIIPSLFEQNFARLQESLAAMQASGDPLQQLFANLAESLGELTLNGEIPLSQVDPGELATVMSEAFEDAGLQLPADFDMAAVVQSMQDADINNLDSQDLEVAMLAAEEAGIDPNDGQGMSDFMVAFFTTMGENGNNDLGQTAASSSRVTSTALGASSSSMLGASAMFNMGSIGTNAAQKAVLSQVSMPNVGGLLGPGYSSLALRA